MEGIGQSIGQMYQFLFWTNRKQKTRKKFTEIYYIHTTTHIHILTDAMVMH